MTQENMADRQRAWEEKRRLTIEECMQTAKAESSQVQLLPPGPIVSVPPRLKIQFWLNDIRYVGYVLAFVGDEGGVPTVVVHVIDHADVTLQESGNIIVDAATIAQRIRQATERLETLTYVFLFQQTSPAARVVKVVS